MALTDRKKTIVLVASILIIGVVIAAAFAVSFSLMAVKKTPYNPSETDSDQPTAESLLNSPVVLEPKFLNNGGQIAEEGHYTFVLEDTDTEKLHNIQAELQKKSSSRWQVTGNYSTVGIFSMKIEESALRAIAIPMESVRDHVLYIEPVYVRTTAKATNLWGLDRLDQANLPYNYQYNVPNNLDGTGVTVYILDTGIRATHTQFEGRVSGGIDYVGDGQGTNDCNGHGTHVAGTVGGRDYGVAPKVNLAPVRVLGCDGSGSGSGVIGGINWVASNAKKPAVASMSLGGGYSNTENVAVERAIARGIVFSVAAGNENQDAANTSPASAAGAITVGATNTDDTIASFSNWGSVVDIFAPGVGIGSAWFTSDTATASLSGTSMACPHVSGVAALYLQQNPTASATQATQAVINGATQGKIPNTKGSPNKLLNINFLNTAVPTTGNPTTGIPTTGNPTTGIPTTGNPTTGTPAPIVDIPAGSKTETGSLSGRRAVKYHPAAETSGYTTRTSGTHSATLTGPTSTSIDFDLSLLKWNASTRQWVVVRSSAKTGSKESISITQPAGTYAWRVYSSRGSGSYTINFSRPL